MRSTTKGKMVIINNQKFDKSRNRPSDSTAKSLEDRAGSEKDVLKLWETFEQLGYLVEKLENLTSAVSILNHFPKQCPMGTASVPII